MTDVVRACYARAPNLGSLYLRTAMWSSWSHVATIVPAKSALATPDVIDARFIHGVRRRPLAELLEHSSKYSIREWVVPDAAAGYAWLEAQVGKGYDAAGVAGIGLHRDWQDDDTWFCSELHEQFLEACGLRRFVNQPHRVTVQHSWMVA